MTDLQLNVLGSVISCLAIVTTCVAQIVSSPCMLDGVILTTLRRSTGSEANLMTVYNCKVNQLVTGCQSLL